MMAIAVEERRVASNPEHSSVYHQTRAPRVVTLTPAPAVDKVYFIDKVQHGEVNRARRIDTYLAGKGINVARSLHLAGNMVSAIVPIGVADAATLDHGDGLASVIRPVEITGGMRTNAILVDDTGTTTNVNAAPSPLTPQEWSRLCNAALDEIHKIQADWLVLGGTLPIDSSTGRPVDTRALFKAAHDLGTLVCLDTAQEVIADGHRDSQPDLIKPNAAELSSMTGAQISTLADVVNAANALRARGIGSVLASLGSDGIVEVSERGALWARGPEVQVVNTTGAGDAALAGYLSIQADEAYAFGNRREALQRAVAWGALAVQQPTTILPHVITDPRNIRIGLPDSTRKLS